jgi:hypothetical protein
VRQRVDPLVQSGASQYVNWATERLPHEVFFWEMGKKLFKKNTET